MVDHDLVSRSGCHRMLMRVSDMSVLRDDEEHTCPIQMEDFDEAHLEFLDKGICFVEGSPQLCVATLPCGHRFCPAAIVYHMCISGMQCPVCRAGSKALLQMACVPRHLGSIFFDRVQLLQNKVHCQFCDFYFSAYLRVQFRSTPGIV